MFKSITAALTLLLICSSVCLADTIVIQSDGSALYYRGETTSSPVVVPSSSIFYPPGYTPDPDDPDSPDDPNDPDPPDINDLSSKIEAWANEIDDPVTALFLSKVYAALGDKIVDGTIDHDTDTIDAAINALVEEAVKKSPSNKGEDDAWNRFHDEKVALELFQLLVANDRALSKDEWHSFCDDVSDGLRASSEGAAIDEILRQLMDILVQVLMEFLLNWLDDLAVMPNVKGPVYV
jgi:hypothetical protein